MSSQRVEGQEGPASLQKNTESPDSEEVFSVLSNRRRRYTLHYLLQRDEVATDLGTLSKQIAAWENGVELQEVTYDQRRNVYTALKQSHLPTLQSAGLVEYDDSRGEIEATSSSVDLDIYIDVVSDQTIPWSQFYLGLGAITLGLTGCRWIGLPLFDSIPPLVWAVLVASAFFLTGIGHFQYERTRKLGADGPPPEVDGNA